MLVNYIYYFCTASAINKHITLINRLMINFLARVNKELELLANGKLKCNNPVLLKESLLSRKERLEKRDLKERGIDLKQERIDKGRKRNEYLSKYSAKYRSYMKSANARGKAFELTQEDFDRITANNCSYCGSSSRIGIDRIDNSEGYTIENATPCCANCNRMKFTHSRIDFLIHVRKIYNHSIKVKEVGTINFAE